MAFRYGPASRAKLHTCHPKLIQVAKLALKRSPYDITIIHGWRGETVQNALFESGASTKRWPDSKHNHTSDAGHPLSLAIDFGPWVEGHVPWKDIPIFCVIAGIMYGAANQLGVKIRWGADWDGDGSTQDHTLLDYGHVELMP